MKITLFSIILLFSINGFAANWKKLSENKSGSSFYVDVENIKKNNGFVYYWILIDYLKSTKIGTYSDISEYKVNCVDEKQTWLSNTFYSQPMAKGKNNHREYSSLELLRFHVK